MLVALFTLVNCSQRHLLGLLISFFQLALLILILPLAIAKLLTVLSVLVHNRWTTSESFILFMVALGDTLILFFAA